ncbi:MAG TPA: hypothetical protein VHE33_06025 [Acidobacteriaceae bacterium]|nr:hypothetical protein [Acidobacteriaceae bacterium]
MDEPLYPSVQGQSIPDLGLAQYGVATPQTHLSTTSDSTPPMMCVPELMGDARSIHQMGIDPEVPYYHLELANDHKIMTPAQLAAPQGIGDVNAPTFDAPEMGVPGLRAGDLTGPGIDHVGEFEPDPHTGDLLQFAQPGGLEIHAASTRLTSDPMLPDLGEYDRPAGLEMLNEMMPDPTLPDLQQPQLEQNVHMIGRPGDLASDAMKAGADEVEKEDVPSGDYKEMWMQQHGRATHRTRHMKMLTTGLHEEGDHDYR